MHDRIAFWVARRLPENLVYWCAVRLGARATLPPYGDQVVPELTLVDALERWRTQGG